MVILIFEYVFTFPSNSLMSIYFHLLSETPRHHNLLLCLSNWCYHCITIQCRLSKSICTFRCNVIRQHNRFGKNKSRRIHSSCSWIVDGLHNPSKYQVSANWFSYPWNGNERKRAARKVWKYIQSCSPDKLITILTFTFVGCLIQNCLCWLNLAIPGHINREITV